MQAQKRNESVSLELLVEHGDSETLSSSLVTEADFSQTSDSITIHLSSNSFNDLRAHWNSIMRALIASEHSLAATNRGDQHQ